jgi:hypothetical protein
VVNAPQSDTGCRARRHHASDLCLHLTHRRPLEGDTVKSSDHASGLTYRGTVLSTYSFSALGLAGALHFGRHRADSQRRHPDQAFLGTHVARPVPLAVHPGAELLAFPSLGA